MKNDRIAITMNEAYAAMDMAKFERMRPTIEAELAGKRTLLDRIDQLRASLKAPGLTEFDKSQINQNIQRTAWAVVNYDAFLFRQRATFLSADYSQPVAPEPAAPTPTMAALLAEQERLQKELRELPDYPPVEHVKRERRLIEISREFQTASAGA